MNTALASRPAMPGPSVEPSCRVLLVDSKELMRVGIRTVLNAQPDVTVVGETVHRNEIRDIIRRARPNVIVAEASTAARIGRDAFTPSDHNCLPLVLMCQTGEADELDLAVRVGARGVVLRCDDSCHVVDAVRAVTSGKAFLAPSVTGYVLDQLAMRLPSMEQQEASRLPDLLTDREREVLHLLASGLTTAQVAEMLERSRATIKSHVSHILTKLGLQDRAQAIAFAYQTGLVTNQSAKAMAPVAASTP